MSWILKTACLGVLALAVVTAGPINEDTYLQALQNSQNSGPQPQEFYGPPTGPVGYNYEPAPAPQPETEYVHHPPEYVHQPEYVHHPPVFYHEYPKHHAVAHYQHQPSLHEWLFNKIKFKLNLFTLGKILLKLLIFKKIVKFIGIICLLLFLPKLGALFKMDEGGADTEIDARQFSSERDYFNERLEESAKEVLRALEVFSKRYDKQEA